MTFWDFLAAHPVEAFGLILVTGAVLIAVIAAIRGEHPW